MVELEGLPADEARAWQTKLHALRTDCGCKLGALVLVLSMAGYAYVVFFLHPGAYTLQQGLIAGGVVFLVSASVGKIAGLLLARYRYNRLRTALAARRRTVLRSV
jgi:hypothetical protein